MFIPIRTETEIRTVPWTNFVLVAANVIFYFIFHEDAAGDLAAIRDQHLVLHPLAPTLLSFFTYQFLHGSLGHLAGNLLFLWVFGNAVNAKMGQVTYLLYYLSGGVFAALGYAYFHDHPLVGASGAISAVTAAYVVLFPRSKVTVFYAIFLIGFIEVPAIILIGLKIILWDNILAPQIHGAGDVAVNAHLAGYLLGFVVTLFLLLIRGLPRDQFDALALLDRWNRRRAGAAAALAVRQSPVFRVGSQDHPLGLPEAQFDKVTDLRSRISERILAGDWDQAGEWYRQLLQLDPQAALTEQDQLRLAKNSYRIGKFPEAAAAFERFLSAYPRSPEADATRLLLGIIYARELQQPTAAENHLNEALQRLSDGQLREQCRTWLDRVRATLGKPAPDLG